MSDQTRTRTGGPTPSPVARPRSPPPASRSRSSRSRGVWLSPAGAVDEPAKARRRGEIRAGRRRTSQRAQLASTRTRTEGRPARAAAGEGRGRAHGRRRARQGQGRRRAGGGRGRGAGRRAPPSAPRPRPRGKAKAAAERSRRAAGARRRPPRSARAGRGRRGSRSRRTPGPAPRRPPRSRSRRLKPTAPPLSQLIQPDSSATSASTPRSRRSTGPGSTSSRASVGSDADLAGYFQGWDKPFRPDAVTRSWERGMLPLLSWESQPLKAANDAAGGRRSTPAVDHRRHATTPTCASTPATSPPSACRSPSGSTTR